MHAGPPEASRSPSADLTVSDVLLDGVGLARQARTTLAGADHGVLSLALAGMRQQRLSVQVPLHDEDGEPVLVIPRHGPTARAAEAGRLVSLALEPASAKGVRLRLVGRLRLGGNQEATSVRPDRQRNPLSASPAALRADQQPARLLVEQIYAGCPFQHPADRDAEQRIPVETYALTPPDYLAAHLPRMVRYVNLHHPDRVRRLAAATAGVPATGLVAASVAELSPAGALLRYVDADGGHDVLVLFTPPARTVPQLAATFATRLRAASTRADDAAGANDPNDPNDPGAPDDAGS